jgi:hypothetical protein
VKRILGGLAGLILILVVIVMIPMKSPPLVGIEGSYALSKVNLIDVSNGNVAIDMTVLVDRGLIVDVMPSEEYHPEKKFTKIAASGKYLIPALWDMHTHSLKVSPQIHHPLFISKGITGVRDMSGCLNRDDNFWACPEDRRRWTQEALAGSRVSPRYILQSSYQTNGGNEVPSVFPSFFRLNGKEAARELVGFYVKQKVDFIKPYTELDLEQYDNLVHFAALNKLDIAGHKPLSVSLAHALQSGQKSIEHGRLFLFECYEGIEDFRQLEDPIANYDAQFMRRLLQQQNKQECDQQMTAMANSASWWVPTLGTLQMGAFANDPGFRQDPRLVYIPQVVKSLIWFPDADSAASRGLDGDGRYVRRDFFEQAKAQVYRAHQLGVKLLAGTDNIDTYVFTGSGLHDELEMMVDAGLSPLQALQTATINAAIFAGLEKDFGSLGKGKQADMVLLNSNPLADINNIRDIEGVFLGGFYYDRSALRELDDFARNMAQSIQLNLRYLWDLFSSPLMRVQLAD